MGPFIYSASKLRNAMTNLGGKFTDEEIQMKWFVKWIYIYIWWWTSKLSWRVRSVDGLKRRSRGRPASRGWEALDMDLKEGGTSFWSWPKSGRASFWRRPESEEGQTFKTDKEKGHLASTHAFIALYLVMYISAYI